MRTEQQRADDVFLATLLHTTAVRRGSLRWNSWVFGGLALAAASYPEAQVDLDRDLALPARAIARLGPDCPASD